MNAHFERPLSTHRGERVRVRGELSVKRQALTPARVCKYLPKGEGTKIENNTLLAWKGIISRNNFECRLWVRLVFGAFWKHRYDVGNVNHADGNACVVDDR